MNIDRRRFARVTALGTVLALALGTAPAVRAQALQEVTYLLPAPAFLPAFGPWMLAQAKGYYAAEGMNVKFQSGRGGVDVALQVGAGNAVVGGATGDTAILVRANGVPVRTVAVLGGRSMMHVAVHDDSPIKVPKDLKGKTITVTSLQDSGYYALLGILGTADVVKSEVTINPAGPAGVWQLFAEKKVDAMAGVPDWIASVRGTGAKLRLFNSDEYFRSMAQAIVASDATIQKQPDLVRKLVRATLKGMQDIMKDPKAAARDYVAFVPQWKGKEAYVEETFGLYNTLVYPGQKVVGQVDPERVAAVQKFYLDEKIIQKASPVADLYTNQFVQQ